MSHALTVAVLGAGALGAAMATRLGETGHEVRLWNRTEERARAVAEQAAGVTAVRAVGDVVSGASVVITVLRDGDAVMEVMSEAIGRLDSDAVWVQASTVGPQSASALAGLARDHGVAYLDAPVSRSTAPARQGKLVWLVASTPRTFLHGPVPYSMISVRPYSTSERESRAAPSSSWSTPGWLPRRSP